MLHFLHKSSPILSENAVRNSTTLMCSLIVFFLTNTAAFSQKSNMNARYSPRPPPFFLHLRCSFPQVPLCVLLLLLVVVSKLLQYFVLKHQPRTSPFFDSLKRSKTFYII